MKKRTVSEKIMWILIIVVMLMSGYYFPRGKAEETTSANNIPSNIEVVTGESQKEIILGTTSEKARTKNLLGLAGEFSVFAKDDVTFTWADTEGRVAAGGTIKGTTSYAYQIGTEVNSVAKIIAGKGISNLELLFTTHNTVSNNNTTTYDYNTKKYAVISTNADNMDWSEFDSEEQKRIIASDLIDFEQEFNLLQQQSDYIANLPANGTIIKSGVGFSITNGKLGVYEFKPERNVAIFRGTDEKLNIFTMTVDEYNSLFAANSQYTLGGYADTIFFDVPYGSHIIINIVGDGEVKMYSRYNYHSYVKHYYKAAVYYPMSEADVASIGSNTSIGYAYDGVDFIKDENGNNRLFQMVSSGTGLASNLNNKGGSTIEKEFSKYLLYNIPQAEKITFKTSSFGSILAPNADVENIPYTSNNAEAEKLTGYFAGTLVCKSYKGGLQFGNTTYTGSLGDKYNVEIAKLDSQSHFTVPGTVMQIIDSNGEVIKQWTTTDQVTSVRLEEGDYILKEVSANQNYILPAQTEIPFNVKGNIFNGKEYVTIKTNTSKINMISRYTSVSISGSKVPNTWASLYNLSTNPALYNYKNQGRMVNSFEFDISTSITGDIYAQIRISSNGIDTDTTAYVNGSYQKVYDTRFSNLYWTPRVKVENNHVKLSIPMVEYMYLSTGKGLYVEFYNSTGSIVTSAVTMSNIKANVYVGTSSSIQTKNAPDYVSLNETEDGIIVKNTHINSCLFIYKKDKDTGELVKGAVYGVYNQNDELITTVTTDITTVCEGLDIGSYYLKEISAPDGYKLSDEKISVKIEKLSDYVARGETNVYNEKIKVEIEKVDENNNNLAGAELTILDSEGNFVTKWTTTTSSKIVEGLKAGIYTLTESFTPSSYAKGKDIVFTVDKYGKVFVDGNEVQKLTMKNTLILGEITISKTGEVFANITENEKNNEYASYKFNYTFGNLKNVEFELYAAEDIYVGNIVKYNKDECVSSGVTNVDGIFKTVMLPMGNYYLVEKATVDGYVLNKTPITITMTYSEDNESNVVYISKTVQNERIKANITAEKIETGTDKKIQGAIFGLYTSEEMYGTIPADTLLSTAITNENGVAQFDIDVPLGVYYVKEIQASYGYVKTEEKQMVTFTAEDLNLIANSEVTSKTYATVFENDYTKIQITKTEVNTDTPIIGATLQLFDLQNNPVLDTNGNEYKWVTDGTAKLIERIPVGTYILKEVMPAPGYTTAQDIEIIVKEIVDLQEFNMQDDFTKLQINKVELKGENSNEEINEKQEQLIGAKLQIFDLENNPVLDSQGNPYVWVTDENAKYIEKLPIGTYILRELEAPIGYIISPDLQFTVEDKSEIQIVTMEDDYTKVEISKIDAETKENITGVTLQIFDLEGNPVKDSNDELYKWVTDSQNKVIVKLPIGKYKLVEIEALPGYIKAEDVEFEVINSGEAVKVIMENKFTKLNIEKLDENGEYLVGAQLQILDENENIIEQWNTENEIHRIEKKLQTGHSYTLTESSVPQGYFKPEDIKFTVNNNGEIVVGDQVVEKITMVNKVANGIIKITKTGEVVKGVTKLKNGIAQFEQIDNYEFNYEEGALSGVVFELYASEDIMLNESVIYTKDQKVSEAVTNEEGIAEFNNINIGSYYFIEKSTLEGYELDKKPVTLVIGYEEDNTSMIYTTTITNERIKTQIKVNKFENSLVTDEVQNPPLKGVVFGLYTKEEMYNLPADTLLSILKTDENGTGTFNIDIPVGKYYIKELETIPGYVLLKEVQEFNFDGSNVAAEFTFKNDYSKVKIRKLNQDNQYVQNAKLQIQDMSGNVVEEWTTTDTYHRINRKLIPKERYKLVEVEAPEGYELANPIEFTVDEEGGINIITMLNIKKFDFSSPDKPEYIDPSIDFIEKPGEVQTGDVINIVFTVLVITTIIFISYNCYFMFSKKDDKNDK